MSVKSILFTISFLGVAQGAVIAFLIYRHSKEPGLIRRLLSLLFAMWSLAILLITLVNSGLLEESPILEAMEYFLGLTVGPLLLFYLYQRRRPSFSLFPFSMLLHFIPGLGFLLYAVYQIVVYGTLTFNIVLVMLHMQVYLIGNSVYYFLQKKDSAFRPKGDWAPLLLLLPAVVGISQWLRFYFSNYPAFDLIIPSVTSLSFYGITLLGFHRSSLLETGLKTAFKLPQNLAQEQKIKELEGLIQGEKLFQKTDLSLNQLALAMQLHPNQLSALIKQHFQKNFREFINAYRVENAKALLLDPDAERWTIEAIASESGFQSRSAFYQAFKTIEGVTPTQFKKSATEGM